MKLYIFRCRARPKILGATRFETASNLPTDECSGGWEFYERVDLTATGPLRFAVDKATLQRQVRRNDYYVWDESESSLKKAAQRNKLASRSHERPPVVHEYETVVLPSRITPRMTMTAPEPAKTAPTTMSTTSASLRTTAAPVIDVIPPRPAPAVIRSEPKAPQNFPASLPVQHQVVWFDIPVRDLDRAVRFYSAVLGAQLKKQQAGPGVAMAVLTHTEGSIGGCLVQNMDAQPSENGPLLYLNTHGRLDDALKAVEMHGGRVLTARHSIAPFGFRAIVLDSEGNRVALHSM